MGMVLDSEIHTYPTKKCCFGESEMPETACISVFLSGGP